MKLCKALFLALCLCLAPTFALAGDDDDDDGFVIEAEEGDDDDDDDIGPAMPEPAGALVMAAGLATAGLIFRHRRRR